MSWTQTTRRIPTWTRNYDFLIEGRVLPDPEATAAVGEWNSVEVERYRAGFSKAADPTESTGDPCSRA